MSSLPSSFANPAIIQSLAQTLLLPEVVSHDGNPGEPYLLFFPLSPLTKIVVSAFTNTYEALPVCGFNCFTSIINNLTK